MQKDNVLNIQGKSASADILRDTEMLYNDARAGNLEGFSYTASHHDGELSMNLTGCHARSPVYAVGALMVLVCKTLKKICH